MGCNFSNALRNSGVFYQIGVSHSKSRYRRVLERISEDEVMLRGREHMTEDLR